MDEIAPSPQRHHRLPGLYNFRDAGGYDTAAGTVRWGKLFRSDALHRIDDVTRQHLVGLGIAHVVDLRSAMELEAAPSAITGLPITVHHLPVFAGAAPVSAAASGIARVYEHIVDERGEALAAAVRVIAGTEPHEAVLVHCTAGKDRTGLVIALALSAVGVARADVVADYALTEANLRGEWADQMLAAIRARGIDPTPEIVGLVTASPAAVLEATLERIDARHGSITDYLIAHGMTAAEIDRLADTLIDRA